MNFFYKNVAFNINSTLEQIYKLSFAKELKISCYRKFVKPSDEFDNEYFVGQI